MLVSTHHSVLDLVQSKITPTVDNRFVHAQVIVCHQVRVDPNSNNTCTTVGLIETARRTDTWLNRITLRSFDCVSEEISEIYSHFLFFDYISRDFWFVQLRACYLQIRRVIGRFSTELRVRRTIRHNFISSIRVPFKASNKITRIF